MAKMKNTSPRHHEKASLLSFASPTCTLSDALAEAAAYLNDNKEAERYAVGGWIELDDAQGWSVILAIGIGKT